MQVGLGLPLVLLLLPYGLVGVGIALSITHVVMGIVSVVLARPVVGVSFRDIGACLGPSTLSAVIALAAALSVKHFLFASGDLEMLPGLASVTAVGLVLLTVYLAALRVFAADRFRIIKDVVGRPLSALKTRRHTPAEVS